MKTKLNVPVSMVEQLRDFLDKEAIELELVTDGSADVRVLECEERTKSDMTTIYAGGWIPCEAARAMAGKLGIPMEKVGALLTHINTKIRECSLGCF